MQGSSNGPFATLLMLVPLVAVPLLAIFGVPQFSPLAASQSDENNTPKRDNDVGLGEAARFADGNAPAASLGNGLRGGAPEIDASRRTVPRAFETDADPFMNETSAATKTAAHGHQGTPADDAEEGQALAGSDDAAANEQPRSSNPRRERPAKPHGSASNDDRIAQSEEAALAMADEELSARPRATLGGARQQQKKDRVQPTAERKENARARQLELDDVADTKSESDGSSQPTLGASQRTPPSFKNNTQPRRHVEIASERIERRGPLTWKAAIHRLNDLGIHKYQMQPGQSAEDFHFSCSYNPTGNARVSRRFEAEANEPLKAVEKVLEQIETWQESQEER